MGPGPNGLSAVLSRLRTTCCVTLARPLNLSLLQFP